MHRLRVARNAHTLEPWRQQLAHNVLRRGTHFRESRRDRAHAGTTTVGLRVPGSLLQAHWADKRANVSFWNHNLAGTPR